MPTKAGREENPRWDVAFHVSRTTSHPAIGRKGGMMKKEDRYLILVIGFVIGWITMMGMGVLG